MTSIDRRADDYRRAAAHIAADPLAHYTRAEAGRKLQAAIQPRDLKPWTPARLAAHFAPRGNVLRWRVGA